MKQRRYLLLAVTLAAVAATPAFGQAVAPTVSLANSGKESAAPIPDFSGIWVHSIPGFEPLASGPTSLVNRSRRNGIGNLLELVGDYTNPILKPEAVQVVKRHGEISLRGIGYPTPRNQCWLLSSFQVAQRSSCSGRTKSPSSTTMIIKSVRCV